MSSIPPSVPLCWRPPPSVKRGSTSIPTALQSSTRTCPPTLPIEQREGRIHRYKGYPVRENLAQKYSTRVVNQPYKNLWDSLFAAAVGDRPQEASDLVPFWMFPIPGGAKIERHVPNYPLSRDGERLEAVKRSLAVYRMVFGQNRQEDLVAYLLNYLSSADIEDVTKELRIDLEPPGLVDTAPRIHG